MSSELTLLRDYKKDKPAPKWCVYYDTETGDIVTVTNREKDFIEHPFIETNSDDARKILMGHVDPKKFAVVDVNQELKLVEKSAVLRIKEAERRLSVIPLNDKTKADVNIIMYINYIYILTAKGISEKTKLTIDFMKRKMREYDELKKEIG